MKIIFFISLILSTLSFSNIKRDLLKVTEYISNNNVEEAKKILINISNRETKKTEDKELLEVALYNLANIYYGENNLEKAKDYYRKVSININSNTEIAIKSNQRLLSIALSEDNNMEAIRQIEILNKRTNYLELPLIANLIYLYEINSEIQKLNIFKKEIFVNFSEIEKGKINNLVARLYLETKNLDNAKKYFDEMYESDLIENKQLSYIGYATIDYLNDNRDSSLKNIDMANSLSNDLKDYILEQIQKLYTMNKEYYKSYEILKKRLKISSDVNLIIEMIKFTDLLELYEETRHYLSVLEQKSKNNFDMGLKLASSNLVNYSEEYLLKALSQGENRAYNVLINIYYGTFQKNKLENLLIDMEKNNQITFEKRNNILKQFEQFIEYKSQKERIGVN